jgi:hypothetical protein
MMREQTRRFDHIEGTYASDVNPRWNDLGQRDDSVSRLVCATIVNMMKSLSSVSSVASVWHDVQELG